MLYCVSSDALPSRGETIVNRSIAILLLSPFIAPHIANAQETVASFSYDSLEGGYHMLSPSTGVFTMQAVDQVGLRTVGDFSRTTSPNGNADFPSGFVSDANVADISLTLNIQVVSSTFATSTGALNITDIDGDTMVTSMSSDIYLLPGGFYFFANSTLAPVQFTSDDGFFNGYNGSWPIDEVLMHSNMTAIPLVFTAPGFFSQDFSQAMGVSGQIVPTPGSAALLVSTGLIALRSRRR